MSYHIPNISFKHIFFVGKHELFLDKEADAMAHEIQKIHCCIWFNTMITNQQIQKI